MSEQFGIVLSQAAYVRSVWEPDGAVFYIDRTIDKREADKLVSQGKAARVPIIDTVGGYLDETA